MTEPPHKPHEFFFSGKEIALNIGEDDISIGGIFLTNKDLQRMHKSLIRRAIRELEEAIGTDSYQDSMEWLHELKGLLNLGKGE